MTMQAVLVLLALAGGALLAAQGPIFSQSATYLGGPLQAALFAFAVALAALSVLSVLTGMGLPRVSGMVAMPRWIWAGGLIGMAMVLLSIHAIPKIGVATFVAAVVCGQIAAALAYDHFGAFGMELRRISLRDLLGAALLLGGLFLIAGRHRG